MKHLKMLICAALILLLALPAALGEDIASPAEEPEAPEAEVFELFSDEGVAPESIPKAAGFADPVFSEWVMAHFDANDDGELSDAEARVVTEISIADLGIESLSGIERFTALRALDCSDNRLTALDLSGNPALSSLICDGNPLPWVDVGPCPRLKSTVTTLAPSLVDGCPTFSTTSKKTTTVLVTLPKGAALLIGGQAVYDPALPLSIPESAVLGVKESLDLSPMEGSCPALYCGFTTSNKKYAKVSSKGVATGAKAGSAVITVTAFDGRTATCEIRVMKAPSKVTLSETRLALSVGDEAVLQAILPERTASALTWTSSNPNALAVENGRLTAKAPGSATVTVSTFNKKKASCVVTVTAPPTGVTLEAGTLMLMRRQTATLKAALTPVGAAGALTWTSDRPDILSVDEKTGLLTALSEGTATVTVATSNGFTDTCAVTVTPGPDRIVLAVTSLKLGVGESLPLNAQAVRDDEAAVGQTLSYATSASKYATVSADGVVTGRKKGSAAITVSAPNGVKAVCNVTVVKAPSSIKLSKSSLTLEHGAKATLTATPSSASAVTWSGYDPEIISVENGVVTGLTPGITSITVSTYNGKKATCAVRVTMSREDIANYRATHPLIAVAHRGGAAYWPENTLEAFRNSASTGADMVELDVQTTSDGVQVIHHDSSFKAGGKTYKIPKNTYAKLVAAKPSLCTLDEALDTIYKTGLMIQLELKESADAKKCVAAIAKHNMKNRTWYISFKTAQLKAVRAQDPEAKLGYIFEKSVPKHLDSTIASLRISALMVKHDLLTQTRLNDWHMAGLLVNVWTINNREDCRRFADMGVDFITSNYPDYAAAVK